MTPFGVLLRYRREERGMSQHELATVLGLDSKQVSAIETGRRRPPADEALLKIRSALALSDAEFAELCEASSFSTYIVRIPHDVSPKNLRLIHEIIGSIGRLRSEELFEVRQGIQKRLVP